MVLDEDSSGVVSKLIATGLVALNCTDNANRSPLSYAAKYGRYGVVAMLLATPGIDVTPLARYVNQTL